MNSEEVSVAVFFFFFVIHSSSMLYGSDVALVHHFGPLELNISTATYVTQRMNHLEFSHTWIFPHAPPPVPPRD